MLNSSDFNNIKIGVVGDIQGFDNTFNSFSYYNLAGCIEAIKNAEIGACVYTSKGISNVDNSEYLSEDSTNSITIYLDNSKKMLEYYARQTILQKIMSKQSSTFSQTSEEILGKINLFGNSIDQASSELDNTYSKLAEQENTLINYRNDLAEVRSEFNVVYYNIKSSQSSINNIKYEINSFQSSFSSFNLKKENLITELYRLRNAIDSNSSLASFYYVSNSIDSIIYDLNQINSDLSTINSNMQNLLQILDNIDKAIARLDEIKIMLDRIDSDLGNAIYDTQDGKRKILAFQEKLEQSKGELNRLKSDIGSGSVLNVNFENAFSLTEDPISLTFPLMLSIIITFTSIVLSNLFILNQIHKPSYLRERITPTGDINFLLAEYLINLFFILIQIGAFMFIGALWFGIDFNIDSSLLTSIFLASSIFILIGMSLAYFISSRSISMLIAVFVVILLFICSDLLVFPSLVDPVIRTIIELNPFVILNKILFDLILLPDQYNLISFNIQKLATLFFIMAIILYISKKMSGANKLD